jgi:hypothetical protein
MRKLLFLLMVTGFLSANNSTLLLAQKVKFKNSKPDKKVEVFVDGKLFTAYIFPENIEKQVLFPILSASGKTLTRGFPIDPRPFERTDHPHQVGLWLNFGDVNGLDFWNNSYAIKPEDKSKYGIVKFKSIVSENQGKGELVTASVWMDVSNQILLNEETSFIFSGTASIRTIDRTTKLTAAQQITFTENKEGLIGLRVDRAFEEPATKPENFLDANGIETEVPILNNKGVNGVYRNADGQKGSNVWGKRSSWVALRADKEGEIITIVILDNPGNPNFPAWSHARGYGLFAMNNLGGRVFDQNAAEVKVILKPSETIVFKHKIIIGGDLTDAEINKLAKDFQ